MAVQYDSENKKWSGLLVDLYNYKNGVVDLGKEANKFFETTKNWDFSIAKQQLNGNVEATEKWITSLKISDVTLKDFLRTWDGSGEPMQAYQQYLKDTGKATLDFSNVTSKAIGILKSLGATLVSMAINMIIGMVIQKIDELIVTTEEAKDALSESVSNFEAVTSEVESLEEQLKTCADRLAELQKLADEGTISVADEKELELLKEQNEELERQIALKQAEQIAEQKDVLKDAEELSNSKVESKYALSKTTGRRKDVFADQELLYAINDYNVGAEWRDANREKFDSGNYGVNEESLQSASDRIQEMYDIISPTIEAYDKLIAAGYEFSDEESTRYEELKKAQDAYLLYNYNINGTKEAFQGLNTEQQKNILLTRLTSQMSEEYANAVLENISEENFDDLWDKDFSFTPPEMTDYATAEEYGKAFAQAWLDGLSSGIEEGQEDVKTTLSYTDQISQVQSLSDGLDKLDKIYADVYDKGDFDWSSILNNEEFAETFSGFEEEYANFIQTVSNSPNDINACQSAFDDLTTAYIYSTDALKNVTEETKASTIAMLEQKGIANAEEIVNKQLQINVYNLAVAEENLNAIKNAGVETSINLKEATAEEIIDIIEEAEQLGLDTEALHTYLLEKIKANQIELNLDNDVDALSKLCKSLGLANSAVAKFAEIKAKLSQIESTYEASNKGITDTLSYYTQLTALTVQSKLAEAQMNAELNSFLNESGNLIKANNTGGTTTNSAKEKVANSEKDFDWIETKISRIQRQITNFGKTVSATYFTWSTRNDALLNELAEVNKEIVTQSQALSYYQSKADSVNLSSSIKKLVREGSINISDYSSEVAELINEYQEWYEKSLDCSDALQDLNEELATLARQKFDNISAEYEGILSTITSKTDILNAYIDQVEARGQLLGTSYYKSLIAVEESNIATLQKQYSALSESLKEAVNTNVIKEGSEEYNNMQAEIYDVQQALIEANTALIEYNNSIRDLNWEVFDKTQEKISQVFICKNVFKMNENVIKIIFKEEIPSDEILTIGFDIINENNSENMSDDYYHAYNTIYRRFDDEMSILLSNDGSVYVEPEPYVPTLEELQIMLENNKTSKITQSKTLLAKYLEEHPLVSDCHGGIEATYTVTSEKQTLMASNYLTYTIAKESGVENPILTWNAAGCECEVWSEEEYITLVLQVNEYVKPLVSLQQSYEVQINACTTQEELDAITIVYDVYGIAE